MELMLAQEYSVYSKFVGAEPILPFIVGEPRIMVWRSRDPLLLFSFYPAPLVFRQCSSAEMVDGSAHILPSIMPENK